MVGSGPFIFVAADWLPGGKALTPEIRVMCRDPNRLMAQREVNVFGWIGLNLRSSPTNRLRWQL